MRQFFHPETNLYIGVGSGFVLGEVQYPANWLDHATEDEISVLGFVPVKTVGERGDERYFDNAETMLGDTLTITAMRKEAAAIHSIKGEDIKAERDRRKAGGVKVKVGSVDKWFHSDDASRIQQMSLVMMGANIPANLQWKTLDGSFVTMTQAVAQSVFAASTASDQAIFAVAEGHRVALEASADPASYDYSGGWPKIYGE